MHDFGPGLEAVAMEEESVNDSSDKRERDIEDDAGDVEDASVPQALNDLYSNSSPWEQTLKTVIRALISIRNIAVRSFGMPLDYLPLEGGKWWIVDMRRFGSM